MPRLYQNNLGGELDALLTDVATSFSSPALADMLVIASPDEMMITIDPDGIAGAPETVPVTLHTASATTATITRGAGAREHKSGIEWVHGVVADDMNYGGMVELETVELGVAATSISFSSIPATYRDLILKGQIRSDRAASTSDGVGLRVGSGTVDSGANYDWYLNNINAGVGSGADAQSDTITRVANLIPATSATTGFFGSLDVEILNYADISQYRLIPSTAKSPISGTVYTAEWNSSVWKNTATVIDIVTFTPISGTNFVAGSYLTLYGRGRV